MLSIEKGLPESQTHPNKYGINTGDEFDKDYLLERFPEIVGDKRIMAILIQGGVLISRRGRISGESFLDLASKMEEKEFISYKEISEKSGLYPNGVVRRNGIIDKYVTLIAGESKIRRVLAIRTDQKEELYAKLEESKGQPLYKKLNLTKESEEPLLPLENLEYQIISLNLNERRKYLKITLNKNQYDPEKVKLDFRRHLKHVFEDDEAFDSEERLLVATRLEEVLININPKEKSGNRRKNEREREEIFERLRIYHGRLEITKLQQREKF